MAKFKTSAKVRRQARQHYQDNKEKYQEYGRLAQARKRKERRSMRLKGPKFVCKRALVREAFTFSDIMKSHDDQTTRMVNQILSGERMLVT